MRKKIRQNRDGSITFKNRAELSRVIREGLESRKEDYIKEVALDASDKVLYLMLETLHTEFGFGKKRLKQFMDRFNFQLECIDDINLNWVDLEETYKEYLGEEKK